MSRFGHRPFLNLVSHILEAFTHPKPAVYFHIIYCENLSQILKCYLTMEEVIHWEIKSYNNIGMIDTVAIILVFFESFL